ncbi:MAG: YidC/Oxa1 family membrane protein insertase [Oscillospiraceae bacterium]|jgi:YidC/Oxa1 family membrane protein insertase|nr:YidC/Oxa1 family membrane protein insertase [Oscillospiraceae bacterium]
MEAIRNVLAIPFGFILSLFYMLTQNYLLSLLLLTLVFKLVLIPSAINQQKGTARQVRFQAKIKKIQEMYKGDNMRIQQETQALYKREGFNPMSSGCAPMLIQFPVMIGLYGVIYAPLKNVLRLSEAVIQKLTEVYLTLPNIAANASNSVNTAQIGILGRFAEVKALIPDLDGHVIEQIEKLARSFMLGPINLADRPDFSEPSILWLIPILSGVTAMLSSVFMYIKQRQTNPQMAKNPTMGCMMLTSPLMSVYFTFLFPAGVGAYWIMSNVLAFIQTVVLNFTHSPRKVIAQVMIDETVERRSRENNIKKLSELVRE